MKFDVGETLHIDTSIFGCPDFNQDIDGNLG